MNILPISSSSVLDDTIDELQPLLVHSNNRNGESEITRRKQYTYEILLKHFYIMSLALSINHGCMVTCLVYAAAQLGDSMGSITSGILLSFYAATSFLASKPIVCRIGSKNGFIFSLFGYFIYVFGFAISVVSVSNGFVSFAWFVSCSSSIIGGIAGGLLWPSQGRYFSRICKIQAENDQVPIEHVTTSLAAIFTMFFLGFEMCLKLFGTFFYLITPTAITNYLFFVYAILSFLSFILLAITLDNLGDNGVSNVMTAMNNNNINSNSNSNNYNNNQSITKMSFLSVSSDVSAAARLVLLDARLALIIPFQIAFGFASSFVPYYVFGTIIADSPVLGGTYVGLLSAVVVLTGALAALPSAYIAHHYGKPVVIWAGSLCLAYTGFSLYIFNNVQLGTWGAIIPLLIVFGIGRGSWENTNKAAITDFWGESADTCTTAYASATFFSGYAGAMGFFSYSAATRMSIATTVFVSAMLGMLGYFLAFRYDIYYKKTHLTNDQKMDTLRRQLYIHQQDRMRTMPNSSHDQQKMGGNSYNSSNSNSNNRSNNSHSNHQYFNSNKNDNSNKDIYTNTTTTTATTTQSTMTLINNTITTPLFTAAATPTAASRTTEDRSVYEASAYSKL